MQAFPAPEMPEDEQVARAIFKADGWVRTTWENVGSMCRDKYTTLAQAAIKTIRTIDHTVIQEEKK